FVTDGLHAATAQAKAFAGDRDVALTAGSLTGQAIAAGLVDEVSVGLVPVVFGSGVRFFGDYAASPVLLDNPQVVQGDRVTHLHSRWHKPCRRAAALAGAACPPCAAYLDSSVIGFARCAAYLGIRPIGGRMGGMAGPGFRRGPDHSAGTASTAFATA